ncbi:MAG: hypothetical protein EZS28_003657 [Streblomastix strix]|uniref:Uncharacterized protein n=1 Tax=Streblomastix strix TaxID=222440 RepID=A0A5J4X0P0_9EUKA|nr:MAG: hypothetical protein EZS28_003657 [Streblomastix strix]
MILELSMTTNKEGRIVPMKLNQDYASNSEQQKFECIPVPKLEHNGGDLLVESKNKRQQVNNGLDLNPIIHFYNECVIGQFGTIPKLQNPDQEIWFQGN